MLDTLNRELNVRKEGEGMRRLWGRTQGGHMILADFPPDNLLDLHIQIMFFSHRTTVLAWSHAEDVNPNPPLGLNQLFLYVGISFCGYMNLSRHWCYWVSHSAFCLSKAWRRRLTKSVKSWEEIHQTRHKAIRVWIRIWIAEMEWNLDLENQHLYFLLFHKLSIQRLKSSAFIKVLKIVLRQNLHGTKSKFVMYYMYL